MLQLSTLNLNKQEIHQIETYVESVIKYENLKKNTRNKRDRELLAVRRYLQTRYIVALLNT